MLHNILDNCKLYIDLIVIYLVYTSINMLYLQEVQIAFEIIIEFCDIRIFIRSQPASIILVDIFLLTADIYNMSKFCYVLNEFVSQFDLFIT